MADLLSPEPNGFGHVSIADASVVEGDSGTRNLVLTVTRTGDSAGAVSVEYGVNLDGSAALSDLADGAALTGTVEFAAGETSKTTTVAVNGDTVVEGNGTLSVQLYPVSGNVVLDRDTATGTIVNDDFPNRAPVAHADAAAVTEGSTSANLWATLLSNDSDPEGNPLSITAVDASGTHGQLLFDPAHQSLRYVANPDGFPDLAPGQTATDSFRYCVRSPASASGFRPRHRASGRRWRDTGRRWRARDRASAPARRSPWPPRGAAPRSVPRLAAVAPGWRSPAIIAMPLLARLHHALAERIALPRENGGAGGELGALQPQRQFGLAPVLGRERGEFGRRGEAGLAQLLRLQPGALGEQPDRLRGERPLLRLHLGRGQAQQQLSLLHPLAFADEDGADHPAVAVLHRLPLPGNDEAAMRGHRRIEPRHRRPAEEQPEKGEVQQRAEANVDRGIGGAGGKRPCLRAIGHEQHRFHKTACAAAGRATRSCGDAIRGSTSSRGPNSSIRPSRSTRMRSTTSRMPSLCETINTVFPSAFKLRIAATSAASPFASRCALGSSRISTAGSPYTARASATRCA